MQSPLISEKGGLDVFSLYTMHLKVGGLVSDCQYRIETLLERLISSYVTLILVYHTKINCIDKHEIEGLGHYCMEISYNCRTDILLCLYIVYSKRVSFGA